MKVGLYPGSFNPWHLGHTDIVRKALGVFDKVIICPMVNTQKGNIINNENNDKILDGEIFHIGKIQIQPYAGFMVDAVKKFNCDAVIRGLRNGYDLQYEQNLQYWNEDLGLTVPVVYFVTDRKLGHISSSAIREINKMRKL